ncbi:hypothetical protein P153DRAFT_287034 [Dothidotthia symphoricarpi CBS 119687]|uniref:S-adenosyl-L-methionine-dependent methyltransferase n=1 Tax=Dothidotthia symphoricarpi CBS 119687 TaxID=1392245 RepID=A0A6A6AG29_9PLEO|nr:uncharacterized protein P153DRAFT_287034 [Dothidotthia symphoricarpi CBS 119687]KAF2130932.1 hypothetical protein P153DRAFT_287034 [Dothidotthia symphoricarpi CBS 119687]
MTPSKWVQDNALTLLRPALLLQTAIYHFIMTVLTLVFIQRRPFALLDLKALRYKSFARLWKYNGEAMSIEMPGPLTELLSTCKGVVLDIGPGSGEILPRFNPNLITAMYGAEPAEDLHPGLLKNAQKSGFGTKYHALLCGAEPESLIPALHKSGILNVSGKNGLASDGLFDEICCVRVLCGVPHPEQTIKELYQLLKPGGRMVICEHVANPWRTEGRVAARFMQLIFTVLGWPFFMGGCKLQRHTKEFLRDAGQWDKFDLEYYGSKDVVPFVVGELVKRETLGESVGNTDDELNTRSPMEGRVKQRGPMEQSYAEVVGELTLKQGTMEDAGSNVTKPQGESGVSLDKTFAEAVKED